MNSELLKDKYELVKSVGKGGFSEVFLALDRHLNKHWAIKKIDKAASNHNRDFSWRSEIELMRGLDNPNLLRIVDFFEDEHFAYVVMDFVDGTPLDELLLNDGKIAEKVVIDIGAQLSRILIYLHSIGIIYRDMKPQNVIYSTSGRVRLLDFGAARYYSPNKTSDTVNLGTVGYAAPEQYQKDVQTDERTDIYNLGATLFHLITGISPDIKGVELCKVRKYNPTVSKKFEHIIALCTSKEPKNRYQNAKELLYDLMNIDDDHKGRLTRAKRSIVVLAVLLLLFFLAISSAIAFRVLGSSEKYRTYEQYLNQDTTKDFNQLYSDYWSAYYLYPEKYDALYDMLVLMEDKNYYSFGVADDIYQTYARNKSSGEPINDLLDANLNYEFGHFEMHLLPKTKFTSQNLQFFDDGDTPETVLNQKKEKSFFMAAKNSYENYYKSINFDFSTINCFDNDLSKIDDLIDNKIEIIEDRYCASKYIVQFYDYALDIENGVYSNIFGDNFKVNTDNNLGDNSDNNIDLTKFSAFNETIYKVQELWNDQIHFEYQLYNKYLILSIDYYIINIVSLHNQKVWPLIADSLTHLLETSNHIISQKQTISDIDSNILRNTILLLNKFVAENMQIYGIVDNQEILQRHNISKEDINLSLNPPEYQWGIDEFEKDVISQKWKPEL